MSQSVDLCIEEINRSIDSLSTLYFKPPGIFHNAVVHPDQNEGYSSIITKLIRDCNPKEELSLFKMDKQKQVHTRKDGKRGILDYLIERDTHLKRGRRLGLPDQKPIVHVPKEFYLKQHDQVLAKKRKAVKGFSFEVDSTVDADKYNPNIYGMLLSKFNDQDVLSLIRALQNGSVTVDAQEDISRRKTLFVEDFPIEAMLQVLFEISNQWPLAEYKQAYSRSLNDYKDISTEIDTLKDEVRTQEDQLQALAKSTPSSSHVVTRLIEKERRDIEALEQELKELSEDA